MKHLIWLCFLIWLPCGLLMGQSLSSSVIGASGGISQGNTISLEWTLGEIATSSIVHQEGMLTEGFHQPMLKVESTEVSLPESIENTVKTNTSLEWQVFPNPVSSVLRILLDSNETGNGTLELTNAEGALISNQMINLQQQRTDLDMQSLPSGSYYLLLRNEQGELLKTAKIFKIR